MQKRSSSAASDASSPAKDMAATKAELLLPGLQLSEPPVSPLDGYSKLEELQMLLQNAAAGGSLLAASAAEAAGLLSAESGECGGKENKTKKVTFLLFNEF